MKAEELQYPCFVRPQGLQHVGRDSGACTNLIPTRVVHQHLEQTIKRKFHIDQTKKQFVPRFFYLLAHSPFHATRCVIPFQGLHIYEIENEENKLLGTHRKIISLNGLLFNACWLQRRFRPREHVIKPLLIPLENPRGPAKPLQQLELRLHRCN